MMEPTRVYRALRKSNHSNFPQTAPLAAKFEDCGQSFERLCAVVRATADQADSARVEDSYGKFLAWGRDSGAADRSVDHGLRKSTALSGRTLQLLVALFSKLEHGIDFIRKATAASVEYKNNRLPMNIALNGDSPSRISELPVDPKIAMTIEHIDGLVGCLMKLMPNLCNPFPVDTYSSESSVNDADQDIELATALFPSASQHLLARLGWGNCRRRKYLKDLQEKRRPGMPFGALNVQNIRQVKKSALRDVAIDAFNFQKPGLKANSPPQRPRFSQNVSYAPSEGDVSSMDESIFSPKTSVTGYTSVTEGSVYSTRIPGMGFRTSTSETGQVVIVQQAVPKPPIPLHSGRSFLCPYCHDQLDVGGIVTTDEDWELHVFDDLEPYMCTFDDCLRAERTFGVRDDWFRHELESHRILKAWVCRSCSLEFDTAKSFETHLQKTHNTIAGPRQIAMMVKLCQKHSEIHMKEEVCPLCGLKLDVESLKAHIGEHLEQLALTSVNGDDASDEDSEEVGSQKFDDNMSEGRTKLEILNDFVEEQLGYVLPDKRGPADKDMDVSNFDFVGDSDEEASENESGLPTPSVRQDTRNWKLRNYLEGKSTKGGRVSNKFTEHSTSEVRIRSFHKSSSSNGMASPLRTSTHPRDADYVGRDGDLATLYKILSAPGRVCTVTGTGGIGKTATAIEYTFRYEQVYSYIFWAQAETRVGCADTFSLIAMSLDLAPDGEDQNLLIELGREFLQTTNKKWLLVFDNVDQWADIEEYIPPNFAKTQGSILITTRLPDLEPKPVKPNYFNVNLKEMSMEESRALLIQGIQSELKHEHVRFHPEYKIAGEIAGLAGLPLALSHVAGYVKTSGCTLAEFLELWNEWCKNSLSARPADASSNEALETVWSIGLSDLGTDALKLLRIMAFLDSDVIQRELLMNDHTSANLMFLHSNQKLRCRKMITDLLSRRLIGFKKQDDRDTFSIHRLLQHRLLQDLEDNPGERKELFDLAFEMIRERLPRPSLDTPESVKSDVFKEYIPHVLTLCRVYANGLLMITPFLGLAELFRDGGVSLWQRGMIYDGCRLLNAAEAVLDQLEVDEDQLRIDIHIATALLIQYFGISHRAESRERFKKILQIREKIVARAAPGTVTKDEALTLCNARADYGNALLQFNDYKEAEPIYHECHAKYKEWGTENELGFEYAKFSHHMAFCRMYHQDFDSAIKLSERAVELISRQTSQPQLTLRYKFDLACIVLQSGDLQRSLDLQKQILKARLNLQGSGKTNYFTLQSYYAVGAGYAHLGRFDEAERTMRTALEKAKERADKGFWPDAAVARAEFHLSRVLKAKGQDDAEVEGLAAKGRSVLARLLKFDPLEGVAEEDEVALFDHLQPVFGGRFTGTSLLKYIL